MNIPDTKTEKYIAIANIVKEITTIHQSPQFILPIGNSQIDLSIAVGVSVDISNQRLVCSKR